MLPFPCRLNTFQQRGLRHPQVRRRLAKVSFWLRMAVSGQENLYQNVYIYIYIYTLCCLNLFDSRNCMLEKTKRHWPFLPTCEACQSKPVFPSKPMSTTSLGLNLMLPDVPDFLKNRLSRDMLNFACALGLLDSGSGPPSNTRLWVIPQAQRDPPQFGAGWRHTVHSNVTETLKTAGAVWNRME